MDYKYIRIGLVILFVLACAGLVRKNYFTSTNSSNTLSSTDSLEGFYHLAQQLVGAPSAQTSTTTFLAVGDIMLSRNVAGKIKAANNPNLPFSNMGDILKSTNFNFGNLESPFAPTTQREIIGGNSLIFGAPLAYGQALADNNFKILNLANNHAFDQGIDGINTTLAKLDSLKILHEGLGQNLDQAWEPVVIESNNIKICFIGASYSSINDGGKATNTYVARIEDETHLLTSINKAKSICQYTVVTMHAGTEYTRQPNDSQINFAHLAINDGADMVIGAHPHWVQTTENYNGKWIFYSLGNFIFDQEWSQDTKEGLTLKITLSLPQNSSLQGPKPTAQLESVELLPIILENYSTPRLATPQESENILNKIGVTSAILK